MVENFTKTESLAYEAKEEYQQLIAEEQFEDMLQAAIKKFTKAPSDQVIDKILNYSKSLS